MVSHLDTLSQQSHQLAPTTCHRFARLQVMQKMKRTYFLWFASFLARTKQVVSDRERC